MYQQVVHQPLLQQVVAERAGVADIGGIGAEGRRAVEDERHAFLQALLAGVEGQVEATEMTQAVEALERGAAAEPGEGLVEPVVDAVILQPGLHQRRSFPLADAGAQFAVDGFAAGIGQSLDLAEVIEIVGSGYPGALGHGSLQAGLSLL